MYVLDANDGSLLMSFATDRPVAADVFVVPDTNTGLAKFAYVADTGGNVYRISGATANLPFDTTAPASWTITKIASLGCDGATVTSPSLGCPMNRKFLSPPDVVEQDGVYHLLIGSGDREKPLQAFATAYDVENKFFMVKDNPSDPEWLSDETATCGSAVMCLDSLVAIAFDGADPDPTDLAAHEGLGARPARPRAVRDLGHHGVRHDDLQHPHADHRGSGHVCLEPRHCTGLQRAILECRDRGRSQQQP